MFTGVYQSLAILVVVLGFYGVDFWLMARYDTQRSTGTGRAWDFTLMVLAALAVLILQPVLLPALSLYIPGVAGWVLQLLGVLSVLAGLALYVWSRLHLQHFYAERVEVQPQHRVVDNGPYALVRHPVFSGFFLIITGLLLITLSLPMLLMALYTYWDFSRAAMQEEALLSQELPEYSAYMQRTARFVPALRRQQTGR